ncbi:MAG TPA: alpha/beta fold hydrolase [Opitutus sp.]|nr:alpha/beta fold hydrolase [Opitutus sp.]
MHTFRRAASVCGVFLALLKLGASEKLDLSRVAPVPDGREIPIMDFFRLPLWYEPTLNPSGTHVAALVDTGQDHLGVAIYGLESKKIETLDASRNSDKDLYNCLWLDDKRLVFFESAQKLYGLGMYAAEVGRLHTAYPLLQYCGAVLVSIPPADRLHPLVWMRYDQLEEGSQNDSGVAVVDSGVKTGTIVDFTKAMAPDVVWNEINLARDDNRKHVLSTFPLPPGGLGAGYMADREGHLAYAFTWSGGLLTMHRWTKEKKWEKCPINPETTDIFGAGDEPDEVIAGVPGEAGKPRVLRMMKASTGEPGPELLNDKEYDFEGRLWHDRASGRVIGASYQREGPVMVWFDEKYRDVQKLLDGFFKGQIVRIIDNNDAGTLFLIATFTDRQPPVYSWVDIAKRTAGLIKSSRPWIDPKRMRPMQMIKFRTRDGRHLDAYVTLPAGASKAHPAPLVVLPHGGPWVRDTWGFDEEVQFLASRGYAVLQPNYRGSPGYDWMFPDTDLWDFRKMHDDVTDATKAMLGTGLVDPGRVAIMGGSFGAYLALSGVVNEPSLYRCAVTIAGVFDWAAVMRNKRFDRYDNPTYSRLLLKLGDPKRQAEKFDEISPVRHVDQVRVPVFVAHGKEDPVADIGQSRELISELEKNHVPHETMIVGGEGHGMAHLKNEVELYERIEAFLARNLAPEAAAAAH